MNGIKAIPQSAILVTTEVRSQYSIIKQFEGLSSLEEYLYKKITKKAPTEVILLRMKQNNIKQHKLERTILPTNRRM